MSSIIAVTIATIIVLMICKKYYRYNDSVRKELETLEEIF